LVRTSKPDKNGSFAKVSFIERKNMKVVVEDVSSVKKTLHIEIPEDDVISELDNAYKNLKQTAKIKGFRPGKAPRSVLERLHKKSVHADVSSKLIQQSFLEAVQETGLKVVGSPRIDPPELQSKGAYRYDAAVEINPELEDIDYKGLTLKKNLYQVGDEEIDMQLKMLQRNLAEHKIVEEDRPARDGDFALIDYEGFKDGKPFAETKKTENFILKIGDGMILKGFDEQVIGMKPGNRKEINVIFPENYANEKLSNLEIDFHVTLHEIRQEVLPEIDDEFAKKLGPYTTLIELNDAIADNLKQGYAKRVEQELHEQIFEALLAKANFEVPDLMVDYELEAIISDAQRSFAQNNMTMEQLGLSKESFAEKYRDTAEKQVKRHLILDKIIEQEKLAVTDEELENGFKEMSDTYNQPLEEIKKYYDNNRESVELFKHALLEKQAIGLIIDNSTVEDVTPEKSTQTESADKRMSPTA
jgi:trigger factor